MSLMGDIECPEVKVEVAEESNNQNEVLNWPTNEIGFPEKVAVVEEHIQEDIHEKAEPFDKQLEMPNVKKEEKPKSVKTCPHCKRTFYHLCALRSHEKYCVKKLYMTADTFNPGKIVIKKEQLTDTENAASNSPDSESNILDTKLYDIDSSVDKVNNDSYSNLEGSTDPHNQGTKFNKECVDCGLVFKSITHARTHLLKKKLYCRKPPYKCKRCGKLFKNIQYLVDHEESKVSCEKWLLFTQSENLADNLDSADEGSERSSSVATEKSDDIIRTHNNLISEHKSELGELDIDSQNSFLLPDNEKESLALTDRLSDTVSTSVKSDNDEHYFSCQKCHLKFLNAYRLRKHVFTTHRKITPQSTRSNPSRLSATRKKDGNSLSPFKCEGGYRCPTCEMVFPYPSRLSTHLFRKGKCYPPGVVQKNQTLVACLEALEKPVPANKRSNQGDDTLGMMSKDREAQGKTSMDIKLHGNSITSSHVSIEKQFYPDTKYLSGVKQKRAHANMFNADDSSKHKILKSVMTKYRKVSHNISGVVPFCKLCQLSFCNKGSLNKHFLKYHEDALPPEDYIPTSQNFGCPFCVRLFLTIKARNAHVRYGHKELHIEAELFLRETQCDICARMFECVSEKQDHYSTSHGRQPVETVSVTPNLNNELKCSQCDTQFSTKHHYSAHVNRYCKGRKEQTFLNQETFNQVFKTLSQKTDNYSTFSGNKSEENILSVAESKLEFECPHCFIQFSNKNYFTVHVNRCSSAPYKEPFIGDGSPANVVPNERSPSTGQIKRTKEEFVCAHCQTKFSYRTLYKAHITRYCPVKKGFPLQNEQKSIGQKPPFSCPSCQMKFLKKHAYENHIQNVCSAQPSTSVIKNEPHGPWYGKQYSCWGCRNIFESRKTLYKHQKTGCSGITFGPSTEASETTIYPVQEYAPKSGYKVNSSVKNWPGIGFSYVCRGCQKRFNSRQILYYHQKTVCKNALRTLGKNESDPYSSDHSILEANEKVSFVCQACKSVFSSKKTLYNHQKLVCKKFAVPFNIQDQKKAQEIAYVQNEDDRCTPDKKASQNAFSYTCRGCQVPFPTRKELHAHKLTQCGKASDGNIEENKTGFSCKRCNKKCLTRKILYVHQKFQCKYSRFQSDLQNQVKSEEEVIHQSTAVKENSKPKPNEQSSNTMLYTCRGCQIGFETRKDMYVHKLSQCWPDDSDDQDDDSKLKKRKVGFVCSNCNKRCFSRKVLHIHKKFQCKHNKLKAKVENNKPGEALNLVTVKEENTKPDDQPSPNTMLYTCRGCQTCFETRSDLYVHKATKCCTSDSGEQDENDKISKQKSGILCTRCNKRCSSRKVLYVHQKFQCKYSKFKAGTLVPVPPPKLISNDNLSVSENTDQKNYSCHVCSEKFFSRKDLSAHQKNHYVKTAQAEPEKKVNADSHSSCDNNSEVQPDIKYCCAQCKEGFSNRRDLHMHKKFSCGRTGDETAVHIEIPKRKRFACKMCSNSFANRKLLYVHHKFDCPNRNVNILDYKDDSPASDSHVKITTKDVMTPDVAESLKKFPNQCPFCKRQYCNPFVRDRHIQLHTMVKAFHCSFCPQTFSRSEYLTRHLQNEHSKDLRYQCGACGLKYAQQLNCIQHINNVASLPLIRLIFKSCHYPRIGKF